MNEFTLDLKYPLNFPTESTAEMITWQLWNAFANIGNIFGKSQGIFENDQVSKKKIQALSD